MEKRYNILVFPCGSEIGLEIYRSLKYSIHINLFGGNSVDDHGKFVYDNYISNIPFFDNPNFVEVLKDIIFKYHIDAIYPAMDAVITKLSSFEAELGCKIIGSPLATNEICLSKAKTYNILKDVITVPLIYSDLIKVKNYPIFMKPEVGYGTKGAKLINSFNEGLEHLNSFPSSLILDYLPGKEYTIDCFTDKGRNLLFSKGRIRRRINNGISVNTIPVKEQNEEFRKIALLINDKIHFRGAWFFQMKENINKKYSLLEVASRLGGSSSLFRNLGVNFALLSIYDAFNYDVKIFHNDYHIELDRALNNKYKINIEFENVYIDFDDCLLIENKVNTTLISLIYQFLNEGKKLILITKHDKEINQTLDEYRLTNIFDEIIHLEKGQMKYKFIKKSSSIFIDDSHTERLLVHENLGIPVFAPDTLESLLN